MPMSVPLYTCGGVVSPTKTGDADCVFSGGRHLTSELGSSLTCKDVFANGINTNIVSLHKNVIIVLTFCLKLTINEISVVQMQLALVTWIKFSILNPTPSMRKPN